MNRNDMDDIFRNGLENYESDINPNEIWAGIQDKKPAPASDNNRPFAWWIIGTLFLAVSATVLLIGTSNTTNNTLAIADEQFSNTSTSNTTIATSTTTTNQHASIETTQHEVLNQSANNLDINKKLSPTESSVAIVKSSDKKTNHQTIGFSENTTPTSIPNSTANATQNIKEVISTNAYPQNDLSKTSNIATKKDTSPPSNLNNSTAISNNASTNDQEKKNSTSNAFALESLDNTLKFAVSEEADNFKEIAIPVKRIPNNQIEKGCYFGSRNFSFAVGAHIAPDLVMHDISTANEELFNYVDERRATEKLLESYHVGVDLYLMHRNGFFIRSGVEYSQINRGFRFDRTWNEININNTTTKFIREKRTTNRYKLIDIPLTLGYDFSFKKSPFSIFVEAGGSMNLLFKKKGDIINPNSPSGNFEPVTITDGATDQLDVYVDQVGLSLLGGIGLRYELMDGFYLYVQPAGKLHLNPFTKKEVLVREQFSRVGLNFGAVFGF